MTLTDQIICIALAALANFATRVTPFLLFRTEAVTPDFGAGQVFTGRDHGDAGRILLSQR